MNTNEPNPNVIPENQLEVMKEQFGIEVTRNEKSAQELIDDGYRKLLPDEIIYLEPLLKLAPQLITEQANSHAVNKALETAMKDSYKCILDSSKHLANVKGTSDIYLGSALDNQSNQLAGQARWVKNDVQLNISNIPDIALGAFNGLSIITGQYFIAQINKNLQSLDNGIHDVRQYLEDQDKSKLEANIQEINEILHHLQFIVKDAERTRKTLLQLGYIRTALRAYINLQKHQIDAVKKNAKESDNKKTIKANLEKLRNILSNHLCAVEAFNVAYLLQIYLQKIMEPEELVVCRDEIVSMITNYQDAFKTVVTWVDNYLDRVNVLNKESVTQKIVSLGAGISADVAMMGLFSHRSVRHLSAGTISTAINELFDDHRKKLKEDILVGHKEYNERAKKQDRMKQAVLAMDQYIEQVEKRAEIVQCESEYFIRYIE